MGGGGGGMGGGGGSSTSLTTFNTADFTGSGNCAFCHSALTDSTGGFKCFRRSVLATLELDRVRSNGYAFQIEMSFRAWKRGFRLREIPIVFVDRVEGQSKMNKKIVREAIWMVWWLRLRSMVGKL